MNNRDANPALVVLRKATAGSKYEGQLWLVGGWVRDRILGLPAKQDIDIVLESDALALADYLERAGTSSHAPVVYPRFGTAMVCVAGLNVELVTARRESYDDDSRKPTRVSAATLEEDASRRDFTINTLLENLHTGEVRDPLGKARMDLNARLIRTPLDPTATFSDDPLRMLRAVRFAVRLGFTIDDAAWLAIIENAHRLRPPRVSNERVRDEFCKVVMVETAPSRGLNLLRQSTLLQQFAPELMEMVGVTQNEFHSLNVWDHVMLALDNVAKLDPLASLPLRLAVLLHDVAKPRTRSVGKDGRIHFYGHEDVGAEMARTLLARLKFPNAETDEIVTLVKQHMRIGEYKPAQWSNAAVRRFVRAVGPNLDELFTVHRVDVSALAADHQDLSRAYALRERIDELETVQQSVDMVSPLTGDEIMALTGEPAGPTIGRIKEWLTNEVIEGRLSVTDRDAASALVTAGAWHK